MKRTSLNAYRVTNFTTVTRFLLHILFYTAIGTLLYAQTDDYKVVSSDRGANDRFGRSVAISGDYAIVGAPNESEDESGLNSLEGAGSAYIYKKDALGEWQQLKKIVASDRAAPDQFGWSVAMSGDLAIIGAYLKYEDNGATGESGAAYIFQKDLGGVDNWGEVTKIIPADRAELDYFGISVDISDEYAVVGAYREDEDPSGLNTLNRAGSAYIFQRDQGGTDNWGELTKLVASDRDEDDEFGFSVGIAGDYIIVGAPEDEDDQDGQNPLNGRGSAYIFYKDEGEVNNWGEIKKIVASDRASSFDFGWSVDISGDNILIGSRGNGAYLFNRNEGGTNSWDQSQKLVKASTSFGQYGASVSINGDYAMVGAPTDDFDQAGLNELDGSGAVYLFSNDDGNWTEVQKVVAADRASGDEFGNAVSIDAGGEFIVGAFLEDEDESGGNTLNSAGSAYIFPQKTVQTITLEAFPSVSYGDESFELVATSSSGLPVDFDVANSAPAGDPQNSMFFPDPTVATLLGSTVTIEDAGSIDIIVTQAGNEMFWPASKVERLYINKKQLDVTANDASRDYREENPEFNIAYSGFLEGEGEDDLFRLPEVEIDASQESNAGTYPITVSGGFDDNYDFNYIDGTLTVNPLPLTITVQDETITYGEELEEDDYEFTYDGLADGDSERSVEPIVLSEYEPGTDAGTYPIEIGEVSSENYTITFVEGTLTIVPAPLVATADDQNITYGDEEPEFNILYSGFLNGEDEDEFEELPIVGTETENRNVGTYPIGILPGTIQNYDVTYENGMLTINPATLILTPEDQVATYGDDIPDFTISYEGFVNNENESVLLTQPVAGSEDELVNTGTYVLFVSGGSAQNYEITRETGTFTINPASLIATADDKARAYGEDNPELTISYEGFVNEENEQVFNNIPRVATEAGSSTDAGEYDIFIIEGDVDNYDVTYVEGVLTINKATLTVTADDVIINEGEEIQELAISYDGFVNEEDVSVLDTAPTASIGLVDTNIPGIYPIVASGGADNNYSFTYVDGELTISDVLGLAEALDIRIYPNPVVDYVTFSSEKVKAIEIYDLRGSRVVSQRVEGSMDLTHLERGNYIVQLRNENRKVIYKGRIIKN